MTPTRLAVSDVAAIALLATAGRSAAVLTVVVSAVFALNALTVAGFVGVDRNRRRVLRVGWRNLSVAGVRVSAPLPTRRQAHPSLAALGARLVLYVGVVARWLGAGPVVVVVAASMAVLLAAAFVVGQAVDWMRARADTPQAEVTTRLATTLAALAPRAVLYVSRPHDIAGAAYVAGVWLAVLEALPSGVVVVVREREHLDPLAASSLPAVFIERAGDLAQILPESVTLALYPGHAARNNHLIRLPGIRDVFIGYGDSDKPDSASPLARVFDEVWVSGPIGRARYLTADVGMEAARIREVGRPALGPVFVGSSTRPSPPAGPTSADATTRPLTVLYAPTREGLADEPEHCSLARMGDEIVETLLDRPDVTVVFRPHPSVGHNDPALAGHARRLARVVAERGHPHRVSTDPTADAELDLADVLVSDVSALITDFLARGRPVIMTNPNGWSRAQFRVLSPIVDAVYLVASPAEELPAQLDLIRRGDPTAAHRARLLPQLLGQGPAWDRFARAVEAALDDPPRG